MADTDDRAAWRTISEHLVCLDQLAAWLEGLDRTEGVDINEWSVDRALVGLAQCVIAEINLDRLQQAIDAKTIDAKDTVNAESLVKAGVLRRSKGGVRLLGRGELKAKLTIEVHGASKSAIAAVEKAGGSVKILAPAKEEGEAA